MFVPAAEGGKQAKAASKLRRPTSECCQPRVNPIPNSLPENAPNPNQHAEKKGTPLAPSRNLLKSIQNRSFPSPILGPELGGSISTAIPESQNELPPQVKSLLNTSESSQTRFKSPDRTYPCHEIRAKHSRKLLGSGRRSRDREGADSAVTRSSDSAQRTRCSATAGKLYVRVCIWRAVQAVRPEDLAVRMAISPAIAPVLFTYGLLSREAAQDRSPWVERSGTLGANTPQRQPRKGYRSVYTPTLVSLRFSGMVAASPSGSAKDERRLRPANRSRKPQTDECWH